MTTSEWIGISGIAASIMLTTIGSAMVLSFKIGGVVEQVKSLEKRVTWLEQTMLEVLKTLSQMQVKIDVLWQHHLSKSSSPMVLNEAGLQALEASDVGSFAEHHYEDILLNVKAKKPRNAYQAQEALIMVVNGYQNVDEYSLKLQEAAFSSGYDVGSLLFVAALSIRDRIITDLGFVYGSPR